MNTKQLSLVEALSLSLPKKVSDKNFIKDIAEILEESMDSGDFDLRSTVVADLIGRGGYGDFPISINEFHGIYWISAPEFDDDGYFTEITEAISFAEQRYESYISSYENDEDCEHFD